MNTSKPVQPDAGETPVELRKERMTRQALSSSPGSGGTHSGNWDALLLVHAVVFAFLLGVWYIVFTFGSEVVCYLFRDSLGRGWLAWPLKAHVVVFAVFERLDLHVTSTLFVTLSFLAYVKVADVFLETAGRRSALKFMTVASLGAIVLIVWNVLALASPFIQFAETEVVDSGGGVEMNSSK